LDVSFYAFWAVSGALLTDKFQIREGAYSPGGWAIHYQEPSLNKLVCNSKWVLEMELEKETQYFGLNRNSDLALKSGFNVQSDGAHSAPFHLGIDQALQGLMDNFLLIFFWLLHVIDIGGHFLLISQC
jgi:hypothetical protein